MVLYWPLLSVCLMCRQRTPLHCHITACHSGANHEPNAGHGLVRNRPCAVCHPVILAPLTSKTQ